MKTWRCKLGLHSWRSSGFFKVRSRFHKCELEISYRKGRYPTPMKKCAECKKEVIDGGVIVFPSIEVSNPFYTMPFFDCQCEKGNDKHREEWKAQQEEIREKLSKMAGKIF